MSTLVQIAPPLSASVRLEGVSKVFDGGVRALDEVSLAFGRGEFAAIIGPSGCGKSTLLRLIAGLEKQTTGRIELAHGARVAFVFQDAHLLPWRNVLANAALPLEIEGMRRGERLERAREALGQVGLGDALGRYPNQLSGGMRMRVSLARALVTEPEILLMDEPFAALDEITRQRLDEQLLALWGIRRMTVIFVTHSLGEAAYLAQRALLMSRRPGRIVLDRALELPRERPASLRGEAAFAREVGVLLSALESAEAGR